MLSSPSSGEAWLTFVIFGLLVIVTTEGRTCSAAE